MAILLITHNLGIVGDIADDVAVMYAGQIVETGRVNEVLSHPLHPYTRALIGSVPRLGNHASRLTAIPGAVPRIEAFPHGCRFHPRCPDVQPSCSLQAPELSTVGTFRQVRCPFSSTNPSTL